MLTILNELGKHRNEQNGEFDLDSFKCVYIATMKPPVQEMVSNFTARLKVFGITVSGLAGGSK